MNILDKNKLKEYLKDLSLISYSILAHFKDISRRNFFDLQNLLLKYVRLLSILLPNFNPTLSLRIAVRGGF